MVFNEGINCFQYICLFSQTFKVCVFRLNKLSCRDGPIPPFCRCADIPISTFANMPILVLPIVLILILPDTDNVIIQNLRTTTLCFFSSQGLRKGAWLGGHFDNSSKNMQWSFFLNFRWADRILMKRIWYGHLRIQPPLMVLYGNTKLCIQNHPYWYHMDQHCR